MTSFMVIEKKADGEWSGMGLRHFKVAPRVGEHIEMNDIDGIGQIYQVIAVVHPLQPAPTAGDIIIRHVTESVEFRSTL